jgi:hypothetical protein
MDSTKIFILLIVLGILFVLIWTTYQSNPSQCVYNNAHPEYYERTTDDAIPPIITNPNGIYLPSNNVTNLEKNNQIYNTSIVLPLQSYPNQTHNTETSNISNSDMINQSRSVMINQSNSEMINQSNSEMINQSNSEMINQSNSETINQYSSEMMDQYSSEMMDQSSDDNLGSNLDMQLESEYYHDTDNANDGIILNKSNQQYNQESRDIAKNEIKNDSTNHQDNQYHKDNYNSYSNMYFSKNRDMNTIVAKDSYKLQKDIIYDKLSPANLNDYDTQYFQDNQYNQKLVLPNMNQSTNLKMVQELNNKKIQIKDTNSCRFDNYTECSNLKNYENIDDVIQRYKLITNDSSVGDYIKSGMLI